MISFRFDHGPLVSIVHLKTWNISLFIVFWIFALHVGHKGPVFGVPCNTVKKSSLAFLAPSSVIRIKILLRSEVNSSTAVSVAVRSCQFIDKYPVTPLFTARILMSFTTDCMLAVSSVRI